MSVSIFMLPFALAARVIMGKKRFEEWVRSSEMRIGTYIADENQLKNMVELAGYDFIDFGYSKKTQFNNTFFFWELVNGKWEAVFSKGDDINQVNTFMERIESKANRKVFTTPNIDETALMSTNNIIGIKSVTYPTNFAEKDLLIKTLDDYGIPYTKNINDVLVCEINECKLTLFKSNKSYYEVKIEYKDNLNMAYFHLNGIDEEYKKNVQSFAYSSIVNKVNETQGMTIEDECVLEDDSILITVKCE